MDGKPLYEYARNGLPLPRPIEPRKVNVFSLELVDWQEAAPRAMQPGSEGAFDVLGHRYSWPERRLDAEQIAAMDGVRKLIAEANSEVPPTSIDPVTPQDPEILEPPMLNDTATLSSTSAPSPSPAVAEDELNIPPPIFTLKMTVSSGTYVRSIVHDLAHALGSAAHVVSLSRTRQGEFAVGPQYPPCLVTSTSTSTTTVEEAPKPPITKSLDMAAPNIDALVEGDLVSGECIPWEVFANAIEARKQDDFEVSEGEREVWEEMVLSQFHAP